MTISMMSKAGCGLALALALLACGDEASGEAAAGAAGAGGAGAASSGASGQSGGGQGGEPAGGGGQGGEAGQAGKGGGAGAANQAPRWDGAPQALTVREGESVRVPFAPADPEGDAVEVRLSPGDGWQARVEAGELVVLGRLDGADTSTLEVTLDDGRGGVATSSVAVTVERRRWGTTAKLTAGGVEAREHPTLLVDPARPRTVVIGGSGYKPQGTPLGDVWAVAHADGAVTALTGSGDTLAPAGSRRAAPVPGSPGSFYLFGGYGAKGALDELVRVDLAADEPVFTLLEQSSGPKARSLHLFASDAVTGRLFVFGGAGGSTMLDDLWTATVEGNKATWTKLTPAGDRPSKRYGFFYGVDQDRGVLYLYSGAQGLASVKPARDLWRLDLRSDPPAWTRLLEGEAVPEGRRNGVFAYDDARDLFYVFGGTPDGKTSAPGLWAYDAREGVGAWFSVARPGEPALRSSGAGAVGADGALRLGFGNSDKGIYADLTALTFE